MRNPPILIAVLGFFAGLAGFSFLFFGLRVIGFDWFGVLGDLPKYEHVGLWGWLAIATGVIWLVAALGLWALQPWARLFAMFMAGLALFEAALALFQFPGTGIGFGMAVLPLLILWYLSTSEVKVAFGLEAPDSGLGSIPVDATPATTPPRAMASAPAAAPLGAMAVPATVAAQAEPGAVEPTSMGVAAPPLAPDAASDSEATGAPSHQMRIEGVEGIGPAYGARLATAGIATTDDLLTAGATRAGREQIATSTGISHALILEWVNNVDLMRVPGVGTQYSDLLEAAGVDSPAELANRNAANLAETIQEVVAARPGTVRRIPTEPEIAAWIEAAAKLPKVVEH